MARIPTSRPLLWAVLVAPGLWLLWRWASGQSGYADAMSRSGIWSGLLLIPTTAVTPLRLLFSQRRWLSWLIEHRGDLGTASFAYAAVHAVVYVLGRGDAGSILREAAQPWLLAGWVALLIFVLFAATTDDAAVRLLRRSWRPLHRFARASAALDLAHRGLKRFHRVVYFGAALALLHWILSAFDPLTVQVQSVLRAHGYYQGPIDGLIGPESRAALRRFQEEHGLPQTGTITPEVLDGLGIVAN